LEDVSNETIEAAGRTLFSGGADLKDADSLQELLKPVNLKHLFKCMVRSGCAFSSDNAAKFRLHLEEAHGGQVIILLISCFRTICQTV
jgi:hypothetical protein